jgi:hypothetical protein
MHTWNPVSPKWLVNSGCVRPPPQVTIDEWAVLRVGVGIQKSLVWVQNVTFSREVSLSVWLN